MAAIPRLLLEGLYRISPFRLIGATAAMTGPTLMSGRETEIGYTPARDD